MNITINQNDNQNIGISNRDTQDIIVNNNEIQTIRVESNTPQTLGINQNENQLILIGGGGAVIGITDVLVNGVTVVSGNIAYVTVPTKTSELQNNSGFITNETDPTVPSYIKAITLSDINNWNSKQNALVSGVNIKTINNESLLGNGNINISGGSEYTAGTGIDITNDVISNTITNYNDLTDLPTIPNKTSDLINDEDFVSENDLSEVAFTGSYNSLSDTPIIPDSTSDLINDSDFITSAEVSTEIQTAIATKQDTLVSGTNIKTINNNSLLGSGDLSIGGGSSYTAGNGIDITNNEISTNLINSVSSGSTIIQANNNNIILRPKGINDSSVQAWFNSNGEFNINGNTLSFNANADFNVNGNKVYESVSLYSGDTAGTVPLNESVSNYEFIEIYFRTNDGSNYKSSVKIISPNNAIASLIYHYYTGVCYIKGANVTVNGNTITFNKNFQMYGGGNYSEGSYISITNVIGYK